jgi:hypothetical protein|tara:strand:+ start:883 stop:1140 length:258 start_codon:yes stop_codon:yes gene_type:complete
MARRRIGSSNPRIKKLVSSVKSLARPGYGAMLPHEAVNRGKMIKKIRRKMSQTSGKPVRMKEAATNLKAHGYGRYFPKPTGHNPW